MNKRQLPNPRMQPLPESHTPELQELFENSRKNNGFVANSVLIMQRKPKMVKGFAQMHAAVWDPEGEVDHGFKRLIGHMVSRSAGCQYCMAHNIGFALHKGIDEAKVAAIWEYNSSPLYSEAERVALDFALAAGAVPNDVTDEMFAQMRQHWSENQIVEIVGVIAIFGFMNRWNDCFATPLEAEPVAVGEKFLASHGWDAAKHQRETA